MQTRTISPMVSDINRQGKTKQTRSLFKLQESHLS